MSSVFTPWEEARETLKEFFVTDAATIEQTELLIRLWNERQRHYHGVSHLGRLLQSLRSRPENAETLALRLAAIYHDAVYRPGKPDNEEQSARMLDGIPAQNRALKKIVEDVRTAIRESNWDKAPESKLGKLLFDHDTAIFGESQPLAERLHYECEVFKEYQFAGFDTYRQHRIAFLKNWGKTFPQHKSGIDIQIEVCESFEPKIAIYPGSFNPFHTGHLSVMRNAEKVFDQVIILLATNSRKAEAKDGLIHRHEAARAQLPFHQVEKTDRLITDVWGDFHATAVVRSVRNGTDLEQEIAFSRALRDLRESVNTVWIPCEAEYEHVSSSLIRELANYEKHSPGVHTRKFRVTDESAYGLVPPAGA